MKTFALWFFVVIWFYHLVVGAGAGFAAWRLWPERKIRFVKYTMIHLHAAILDSLSAIVLLFLAKGVHLTWKFSAALFAFTVMRDCVRLPLIFYVMRGPKATEGLTDAKRSGEMAPEYWQNEFRQAIRSEVKDEFLK